MQAMPANTNDSISAGPVLSCAATPVRTKIPVPMIAPTPRLVSATGPRTRRSRCSPAISFIRVSYDLVANSLLAMGSPRKGAPAAQREGARPGSNRAKPIIFTVRRAFRPGITNRELRSLPGTRGPQVLLEEGEGARPGQGRRLLVVARLRRVVVEGVLDVRVHVQRVRLSGLLERLLERRDPLVDAGVEAGVVQKQGGGDPADVFGSGLPAVIDDAGVQVGGPDGQLSHHPAAPAESDRPHLAGALRVLFEEADGGHQVARGHLGIELADQLARGVLVRGSAAQGRQQVRRQREEPFEGRA